MVRSSCNRLHIPFAKLNIAALIFISSALSLVMSFGVFIQLLWLVFHQLKKKVLCVHRCEKLKYPETYLYKPHQSQLCSEFCSAILNVVTSLKPLNPYPISGNRNALILCTLEIIISVWCWHNLMSRWFQLFPDIGMFLYALLSGVVCLLAALRWLHVWLWSLSYTLVSVWPWT